MNGLERIGQLAGTLSPGGVPGWLEYAAVALLVACAVAVPSHGIAAAWRTRKRNGRHAPGPPPGSPVTVPVRYEAGVLPDGEPLEPGEVREFAAIVWQLRNGTRRRKVTRRRRTVRSARATQRTGRK